MKTKDLVSANLNRILEYYDLPKPQPKTHIKCPICSNKRFRMTNYKGVGEYICTCSVGNLFDLLERALGIEYKRACKDIDDLLGNKYVNEPKQKTQNDLNLDKALEIAKHGRNIKGTNVQAYLNARGIYNLPEKGLFVDQQGNMVAIGVNQSGKPSYMHTTFLNGDKKADVEVQKKIVKLNDHENETCVVRLGELKSTMMVAEGIESALSAAQIYKGTCWATLNSGNLAKFRLPSPIDTLIVCADNDPWNAEGLTKAMMCVNANLKQKLCKKAIVRWCDVGGYDFNDMVTSMCGVFELTFGEE